jgi:hypothetical protein
MMCGENRWLDFAAKPTVGQANLASIIFTASSPRTETSGASSPEDK